MKELGKVLLQRQNKTIYLSKDEKSLIKVFNHNLVKKSEVLQEGVVQARVEELNAINLPHVEEVSTLNDDWCLVSSYVEGETLAEKMNNDPTNLSKYLDAFVKLQLEMNKQEALKLQSVNSLLAERIDMLDQEISASSRYELHVRLNSLKKANNLVHFDFTPENIIVTSDNKFYIVDWAHARKGDPVSDIALTYLNFVLDGKQIIAENYLKLVLRKSQIAKQEVFNWIPLVSAYKLSRGNLSEENKKYLLEQTNVADYQ